jgi:hypothetical protein
VLSDVPPRPEADELLELDPVCPLEVFELLGSEDGEPELPEEPVAEPEDEDWAWAPTSMHAMQHAVRLSNCFFIGVTSLSYLLCDDYLM